MKIYFSRTGGFAPIPLNCQLDTDQMEPAQAAHLVKLVEDSGITDKYASGAEVKGARDMHYYTITVEKDGSSQRVRFDHISVPKSAEPLIKFLMSQASHQQIGQ